MVDLGRRDFLRLGLLQAATITLPIPQANATTSTKRRNGPSVLQGATDDSKTQFSVVHSEQLDIHFEVRDQSGQVWQPDQVVTHRFSGQDQVVTKVYFSRLFPNHTFQLNLFDEVNGSLIDSREFQTLDLTRSQLRFALCSCMDDTRHEPKIWQDLVAQQPDFIFFIGDSVYVDFGNALLAPTPERLWRRFCEARQTLEIYYSKRLIPIIATWDDHDFSENDADSNYPHVPESQKNFLTFFAQDESHCSILQRGPGVSSVLNIANQLIFLLDDRSYRQHKGSADRYAHWGIDQEQWMLNLIRNHQGPSFLLNGSQIFPKMVFKESVSGDHQVQFDGLLQELKTVSSRAIFASGDVHFSEISKIESAMLGYETYEITSSSIHSRTLPGVPGVIRNDRRMASTPEKNYVLVESTAVDFGAELSITSRSKNGQINFQENVKV